MQNFTCAQCGNRVYFENVRCLSCGNGLGFDPRELAIATISDAGGGLYRRVKGSPDDLVRYCTNSVHAVCNWLTPATDFNTFCAACDLNRTIPNLSEPGSLAAWHDLEQAKKRLVYALLRFGLPLDAGTSGRGQLIFDFVRHATTGHLAGVITIDIMEADAVERERQRQHFAEPYRSLLGHLRHESGHFYWMVLVEGAGRIDEFRALFGDERQDYSAALQRHYGEGARPDWAASHVSAYASTHPWEDWAETWAHYLHIVSAVDTAEAAGMEPRASGLIFGSMWPFQRSDVYREVTFEALMERWIPLTLGMNSMSRSMGHNDFYPFVIPAAAYAKLAFVHKVIRAATGGGNGSAAPPQ